MNNIWRFCSFIWR